MTEGHHPQATTPEYPQGNASRVPPASSPGSPAAGGRPSDDWSTPTHSTVSSSSSSSSSSPPRSPGSSSGSSGSDEAASSGNRFSSRLASVATAAAATATSRAAAARDAVKAAADSAEGKAGKVPGRPGEARQPRRARLTLSHINVYSVFKFSCVLAIALFFVWLIMIGVLYGILDIAGVLDKVNDTARTISGDDNQKNAVSGGLVFGAAVIIGAVYIVLFIAISTIGSMIYNLCADLVGGAEVTLSERE